MPTNPVSPNTEAAIDRLALGIEFPRGAEASNSGFGLWFAPGCFEAEASGYFNPCGPCCFEGN